MKKQLLSDLSEHLKELHGLPKSWFDAAETKITPPLEEDMARLKIVKNTDSLNLDWPELEATALSCTKCRLSEGRNKVVFGVGKRKSPKIVFVGEGPGADEDKQGEPFVGRAGQLLTKAITDGMGLSRQDVYICNVVKCRPPENRMPLPDEVEACRPYLERQLELLPPKVIIVLGQAAQKALCGNELGITKLRGNWLVWRGIKVMPTLHPAYLLRNPPAKKDFWEDLKLVMKEVGLPLPEVNQKEISNG